MSGFMTGSLGGGGVKWTPPPLFLYCDTNLKHLISFWRAIGPFFNNLKKCKFAKIQILIGKSRNIFFRNCATEIAQITKNYTFLKNAWPSEFKSTKTFLKCLKPKFVFEKNWKCANFLQRCLCKNLCKISLQKLCTLVAFVIGFPKSYIILKSKD